LIDLKSVTLGLLLEHMGLADSIRWTYAIRERRALPGNFGLYFITKFNYDPVTLTPSSYVNGTLYTYHILEIPPPLPLSPFADAVEDIPPRLANEPINIPISSLSLSPALSGYFYTGLTRDDVGGLRYLYRPRNVVAESLLTNVLPAGGVWAPYLGTNVLTNTFVGTNLVTTVGLRPGVDKITFRKVQFDSLTFTPFTIQYEDRVAVGKKILKQSVLRTVAQPDIIFTITDLNPAIVESRFPSFAATCSSSGTSAAVSARTVSLGNDAMTLFAGAYCCVATRYFIQRTCQDRKFWSVLSFSEP